MGISNNATEVMVSLAYGDSGKPQVIPASELKSEVIENPRSLEKCCKPAPLRVSAEDEALLDRVKAHKGECEILLTYLETQISTDPHNSPRFDKDFETRLANWKACNTLVNHTFNESFHIGDWVEAKTGSSVCGKNTLFNGGDVGKIVDIVIKGTGTFKKQYSLNFVIQWRGEKTQEVYDFESKIVPRGKLG